jgi:hypothetical protein
MCCRLRFDFSNNGPVDAAQLGRVEAICREWVAAAKPVTSKEVSLAQAQAIKGLRAVFGEVGVCMCWPQMETRPRMYNPSDHTSPAARQP